MDSIGLHKFKVRRIFPDKSGQLSTNSNLELENQKNQKEQKEQTDLIVCGHKVLPYLVKYPLDAQWLSGLPYSPKGLIIKASKELNWRNLLLGRLHQSLIEAKAYNVFWVVEHTKEVLKLNYLGIKAHTIKLALFEETQIYKPLPKYLRTSLSPNKEGIKSAPEEEIPSSSNLPIQPPISKFKSVEGLETMEKLERAKLYALCKSNLNIILNQESFLNPTYTFLEINSPIEKWKRKEV